MSSQVEIVRRITEEFCLEFVENPYLCYTEHGLHALLFTRLYNALPDHQRYTCWEGHKVCVIQKEYPMASAAGKSRRQHWDIAVIQTPPESTAEKENPSYDYLELAAVVELGLNEAVDHLQDDIDRLCHNEAHVHQGFVVHLYRLSQSKAQISGRDWPTTSSRIVSVERAKDILEKEASQAAGDREVEILYAVAGETGEHEMGAWRICRGETTRLI